MIMQAVFVAYLRANSGLVVATLAVGLFVAWGLSYGMGGSHTPYPHLFYLPIILATVRLGWLGGLGTATAAGLLAGPALPADVALGTAQPVDAWLLRLLIFVAVCALVLSLTRPGPDSVGRRFNDSLVSSRLVRAVERGEIEVHYQPICDAADGMVVGFEALSRWTPHGREQVPPDQFIPQAERTGAVAVLDRFVLREAVRQAQAWGTQIAPVDMSVNISAARFAEVDLVTEVTDVLAETGLAPARLQLEITESAIIEDVTSTQRFVTELRKLGVRVAIDDFGTGQSSLSYLEEFAVDSVKIDRTLVAPISSRAGSGRLVTGIIRFLHALDLTVVAEGVETPEQLAHLRRIGCPLVQGYHLGRPAPAATVEGVLLAEEAIRQERARTLTAAAVAGSAAAGTIVAEAV